MVISCVTYANCANYTTARNKGMWGYDDWSQRYKRDYGHDASQRFEALFYTYARRTGGLFLFIVTNDQSPQFWEDIDGVNARPYLIKTVKPAINSNYPENGVNLNMYIFNIPKEANV